MSTLKPLIRSILNFYIQKNKLRRAVQASFLKHYSVVPLKVGDRILRKEIFETIEESLRLSADRNRRHEMTAWLKEIGVVPVFSHGYRYFKDIKKSG